MCLSLIVSNTLALNFTIICMVDDGNSTESTGGGDRYDFSVSERSWLFSAIAVGAIIGTAPFTFLNSKFGLRRTFFVNGLISALATLLSPFAASVGFLPLFLMRILQGLAYGTSFPTLGAITSEWSPLASSGMYVSLMSCYLQFGPIIAMPLSAQFCESDFGWSGVYYLQGLLTLACFILFYWLYRDSPRMHRKVSAKELDKIEKGKSQAELNNNGNRPAVPYKAIFTDLPVWGVFVSNIGSMLGFLTFMLYGPVYLNKVLE
ncbi:Protein F11A5.9 [Aphelenchoides avenae]|nr:Protein F11A5.9 [Aphelenchus avenae]